MRFFKKIQDWILKSERIRKRILSFRLLNRSIQELKNPPGGFFRSFDVPWSERSWIDLFSKETQIRFQILSDIRFQSWIFLKKRTLSQVKWCFSLSLLSLSAGLLTKPNYDAQAQPPSVLNTISTVAALDRYRFRERPCTAYYQGSAKLFFNPASRSYFWRVVTSVTSRM